MRCEYSGDDDFLPTEFEDNLLTVLEYYEVPQEISDKIMVFLSDWLRKDDGHEYIESAENYWSSYCKFCGHSRFHITTNNIPCVEPNRSIMNKKQGGDEKF